jgi:CarD family transcriptional regulator
MMFSVGEKVMHCAHGAGVITGTKEMQFVETPKRYFVIQLLGSDSTLMVPTDQAEERLRPACKRAALRRLLISELTSEPEELPGDYKMRQKYLENKLKSGETQGWIEVVRDLTFQGEQKPLSQGDQKLLDRAMDLLSGELALAQGISVVEAKPRLESIIRRQHKLVEHQDESASWWQTLGKRVIDPFAKSSIDTG